MLKYNQIKLFIARLNINDDYLFISGGFKNGNGAIGSASSSRSTSPSQQQPPQSGLSFIPQPRNQSTTNRQQTATTPR